MAVTYNAATAKRKAETFARYEKRFLEGMRKLNDGYLRTSGRQIGYPQAAARAAELVPTEYASALKYELSPKPKTLTYEVNQERKARLLRHFGRRMFFTDLDFDAEAIARTFEERTKIEEEFRWMKGDEMMPFSPLYVRRDESILAHAFMTVMGMLLWRLTWKRIREAGIREEEREVLEALEELDLVLMSRARRGSLHGGEWKVAEHGPLAEKLVQKLELGREIPA